MHLFPAFLPHSQAQIIAKTNVILRIRLFQEDLL